MIALDTSSTIAFLSGERGRDSLRLYGSGFGKAVLCEVALQESGKGEIGEIVH